MTSLPVPDLNIRKGLATMDPDQDTVGFSHLRLLSRTHFYCKVSFSFNRISFCEPEPDAKANRIPIYF
jgi:hypothetical protein